MDYTRFAVRAQKLRALADLGDGPSTTNEILPVDNNHWNESPTSSNGTQPQPMQIDHSREAALTRIYAVDEGRFLPLFIACSGFKESCFSCGYFDVRETTMHRCRVHGSYPAASLSKSVVDYVLHGPSLRVDDENGISGKVQTKLARMTEALELIAMPPRRDGTYNRCREACQVLARETLVKTNG